MSAYEGDESVLDSERAEADAEAREHTDDQYEWADCTNRKNHRFGYCHECGLGMSTGT